MKKLKYLSVLSLPITVHIAFTSYGAWSFLPVIFFFGLVPIIEMMLKPNSKNLEKREREMVAEDISYDWIIYIMVPVQIFFLVYFFSAVSEPGLTGVTLVGRITSMGLMCGVFGINLGHELGHRRSRAEQFLGELLLLTSLENHFLPYHNYCHHKHVGTPKDPATARKGEPVYLFWLRSQIGSYVLAWQVESDRLRQKNQSPFSFHNRMVGYTLAQLILLSTVFYFFGWQGLLAFMAAATMGILLLETVNYIEHYGLVRKIIQTGEYERVQHKHSWNSDHVIGRILLFELSRHSDHHYRSSKKYPVLDSMPQSPQMPTGYPGMMVFSLFTPLWFLYMHKKLGQMENQLA
jgi:alkane 1-monooxygenase